MDNPVSPIRDPVATEPLPPAADPLLNVRNVQAGYGGSQVLFGVGFQIGQGEALGLLGRNGMGKTTTIRTIMGLLPLSGGAGSAQDSGIDWLGRGITGLASHKIARLGIGLVPEGRRIFPTLSTRENLQAMARSPRLDPTASVGGSRAAEPWTLDRVLAFFPRLAERLDIPGQRLSGGEQQMLAIGRALMTNPRLLILDEATEGLAPLIRKEIWERLRALKAEGLSILVVDKHVEAMAEVADRFVVLEKGTVAWTGTPQGFLAEPDLRARLLGV